MAKIKNMVAEFKGFAPNDMRSIKSPVFISVGDRADVRPEHAAELYRLIPNAQLSVFPGADHLLLWMNPEKMLPQIADFLNAQ